MILRSLLIGYAAHTHPAQHPAHYLSTAATPRNAHTITIPCMQRLLDIVSQLLQHAATHCNTLQRPATHTTSLSRVCKGCWTSCLNIYTLQHNATHCNTHAKAVGRRVSTTTLSFMDLVCSLHM